MKQKLMLVPGKKYRGSFWVNEYGEIQVSPEQKGTNPQGLKLVHEGIFHKLFTSKNNVKITVTLQRDRRAILCQNFRRAASQALADLFLYDLIKD